MTQSTPHEQPPTVAIWSRWLARWFATPLYLRIVAAVLLGLVFGRILGPRAEWLELPGQIVLQLLKALAPALVLLAVVRALMHAQLGNSAWRLIRLLVLNTLVAITIGLLVANVVQPGRWSSLSIPDKPAQTGHAGLLAQFLQSVPKSLLGPLGDDGQVLSVIVLAVAFGIALRQLRHESVQNVDELTSVAFRALVIILHWILEVIPLAVFGIVAGIVGVKGFGTIFGLGAFVLSVLLALTLQATYYLLRIRFGSWVRPAQLLRSSRDALVMAYSTGSSTATMPVTYSCLKDRLGLREQSASMGALVGANFNNDGTALYEAMAALFVAQGLGQHLTLGQQFMVVLTSIVASVGAAGIPEAGLVTMTLVFDAVGLPTQYIAMLVTVDWFLDRCRTAINVMGDMNVACLLDGKHRLELPSVQPAPLNALAAAN